MEESEKRRERLRAMRMEADEAHNFSNSATPAMPSSLSNPLTDTPPQEQPRSDNTRFDFYTDPMSAFRRDNSNNPMNDQVSSDPMLGFPGPRITGPSPHSHQYRPNQQMYQPQGFGHNPIPYRAPMGISRPYHGYQGNQDYPIGPGFAPSYNHNSPSLPSPGFRPTGSPYHCGQGRPHWVNNSPSSGPGRGGRSPGYGRRGGRGPSFGGRLSGPESFFNESMIEDPWKHLEPVIWTEIKATSSGLRVPHSLGVGTKKARVSDASNKSDSQPSLAEYLAASFNEAVNDPSST